MRRPAACSPSAMKYSELADLLEEIEAAEREGDLVRARALVHRALALVDHLEDALVDSVDGG